MSLKLISFELYNTYDNSVTIGRCHSHEVHLCNDFQIYNRISGKPSAFYKIRNIKMSLD